MRHLIILFGVLFSVAAYAATETINWFVDGGVYATTTCESGGDIILPTTPTKYGYTFHGWNTYMQLEYIQAAGAGYFDTGYIPNNTTSIKAKFMLLSVSGDNMLFGGGLSYMSRCVEAYLANSSLEYNYNGVYYAGYTFAYGDILELDWRQNVINYVVNDTTHSTVTAKISTFSAPYTMYIFNINRGTGKVYPFTGRLYYFQIYDGDTLVRNFIPVLDPDGTACMYDLVEQKYYYNAGTGDFIAGPVIGE